MSTGFNDADPEAILAWDKRMAELVKMNDIQTAISSAAPVSTLKPLFAPSSSLSPSTTSAVAGEGKLTKIQKEWFE